IGTHVVHATNVPTNRQFKAFRTCISSLLFNSPARTGRQDDTPCFRPPFKGQPSGRNLRATKRPSFDLRSFVDHAHPATPEPFEDAVIRNRLADHLAEILGLEVGQVNEGPQVGVGAPRVRPFSVGAPLLALFENGPPEPPDAWVPVWGQ